MCEETISSTIRRSTKNSIPEHKVGLFGAGFRSLNPNAIAEQSKTYSITISPSKSEGYSPLLSTSGIGKNIGFQYSFVTLFNIVELDPVAAEPFPQTGIMGDKVNWEWNLEALNVDLGLNYNNAHVQPTGRYHYHVTPTLYLENKNLSNVISSMPY